jgi:hypothetical protein
MSDKRCDNCINWTPRNDIGYCKKSGTEDIDSDDVCGLYKIRNKKELDELIDYLKAEEIFATQAAACEEKHKESWSRRARAFTKIIEIIKQ